MSGPRQTLPARLRSLGLSPVVTLAYALVVAGFLWVVALFYIPGKGFSYLIDFGDSQESVRISKVRRLERHVQRASNGYDAQFYVQIAMDPSLQNRELRQGVDNLSYRARRILFAVTAYLAGAGRPDWILQAYATQNIVAWLLLAALLLHWFPPSDWDRFFRWAGILLSSGLTLSVRNALFDGPSLLVLAFGIYLLEKGRPWASTAVLGLSGLGKETSLLGTAAFAPAIPKSQPVDWLRGVVRGSLAVLPLALWLIYIDLRVGSAVDAGIRNFDWPLVALFRKAGDVFSGLGEVSWMGYGPIGSFLALLGVCVQAACLVIRPRVNEPWWRVGIGYALLMAVLGDAVWEGYPGAASRVLLPMHLAFNVLVPSGGRWRWVLLAGNIAFLNVPDTLEPPMYVNHGYQIGANTELYSNTKGDPVGLELSPAWHNPELGFSEVRLWAQGDAFMTFHNPHAKPLLARVRFEINAEGARQVRLKVGGREIWSAYIAEGAKMSVSLPHTAFPPGDTRLEFQTDQPGKLRPPDPRTLAFCLRNLRIDAERLADPEPSGR